MTARLRHRFPLAKDDTPSRTLDSLCVRSAWPVIVAALASLPVRPAVAQSALVGNRSSAESRADSCAPASAGPSLTERAPTAAALRQTGRRAAKATHGREGAIIGAAIGAAGFGGLGYALCGVSDTSQDCVGGAIGVGLLGAFVGGLTGAMIGGSISKTVPDTTTEAAGQVSLASACQAPTNLDGR